MLLSFYFFSVDQFCRQENIMPVLGTMTSVSWETMQDPTLIFGIPIVGYQLPDGSYLENQQLEPDFKVANSPDKFVKGEDEQLAKAVQELLKELK